jgi:hypothetical protein
MDTQQASQGQLHVFFSNILFYLKVIFFFTLLIDKSLFFLFFFFFFLLLLMLLLVFLYRFSFSRLESTHFFSLMH